VNSRWKRLVALEVILAGCSAALFIVTLIWRDWIEDVLHVHPDTGAGEAEWFVSAALLFAAVALSLGARRTWRRRVVTAA
jgi:hypothetical protein